MSISPGIYRHYKGGVYCVVAIAKLEETLEPMVVYHPQPVGFDNGIGEWWVRPLSVFEEEVEYKGAKIPRFKFISKTMPNLVK